MATMDEYVRAAQKNPKNRSPYEQSLVEKGQNLQQVRNAEHETEERIRRHGY